MPRIYTSANDPIDFCMRCFPKNENNARELYAGTGEGPDGRGDCFDHDADHPPYENEDYKCCKCKKPLVEKDNWVVE